jgi:hypothetical protein
VEFTNESGAVNITNSSVYFCRKLRNSTISPTSGAMTIENATGGIARYDWAAGDTNTPGIYSAEFAITFSDGRQLTFPNDGFMLFEIAKDIN